MANNLKWSIEDLKKKNLVSNSEGDYVPVSSLVNTGKVDKSLSIEKTLQTLNHVRNIKSLTDLNRKYPMTIDECCTTESQDTAKTMEVMKDYVAFGTAITRTETDLFGHITTTVISPPVAALDPLSGEYILWVRTLTGKAKDNAKMALKQAAEQMMAAADTECFYISGNVASSKNSKEIGRFKKRNEKGELEEFSTLVDSKVTRAYREATYGQWLQNKVAFKNAVQGLKLPISIEFTFIRDSLRRVDHHNTIQIIADMMVEYGWLPDDDTVYLHPVFNKTCFYHKQLAGVLIKIIK